MRRGIVFCLLVALLVGASWAQAGGTSIGGSDKGSVYSAYVSEWCRGNQALLGQYRTQAKLADLQQDTAGVVDLLLKGLHEALDHPASGGAVADKSLSYKAIVRGIEMAEALLDQSQSDPNGVEAARVFLFVYYDFLDFVADSIDMSLYIPYQYHYSGCHGCAGFDEAAFERRYVQYADAQIDWFLATFVTETAMDGATPGTTQVVPRYSTRAALKLLEYLTKDVAEDLANSLWAAKFACAIRQLELLNHNLAAHNGGNRAFYANDRYALNIVTDQIKALKGRLSNGCLK